LSIEEKYDEIRQLITIGKEKGYLLYEEVNELLPADITSSEELDDLFSTVGSACIEVDVTEKAYRDDHRQGGGEGGEEGGELDLTPGALDKTNDPVRMYLREMGTVPLLDREGEVEIAQRIEQGEWLIYEALCENTVVLRELLRLNELAAKDKGVLRELTAAEPDEPLETKAADRFKRNLTIFEAIGENDGKIGDLK
jgi:RNA polymerase primary sigma factor